MTAITKHVSKLVAAISLFAVLLCMPAAGSASAAPTQAQLNAMADEIGVLVNEARAANGLKSIYMVPAINGVSMTRAKELPSAFSHNRPNGSDCFSALGGINYRYASENIAAGSSTAAATFDQWRNSPKHWSAILNPDITHFGVGVAYSAGSQYTWYWEQMFIQTWDPNEKMTGQYLPSRNGQSGSSGSLGDINGDGKIDSSDATMVLVHYSLLSTRQSGNLSDSQKKQAELTGDGKIDASDATVILRYYSYLSTGGKNSMSQFIGR